MAGPISPGVRTFDLHSVAFWLKPVVCAFSLFPLTVFIEHSHVLTILPTLGLSLKRFQEHFCFTAWVPVVLHRRYVVRGASIAHVGYCGWDRRSCPVFPVKTIIQEASCRNTPHGLGLD